MDLLTLAIAGAAALAAGRAFRSDNATSDRAGGSHGGQSPEPREAVRESIVTPNGHRYVFRHEHAPEGVRSYIERAPSYGSRDADAHRTHRYYDRERGEHFICYEPRPQTLEEAQAVAKVWAEKTDAYIERGTSF